MTTTPQHDERTPWGAATPAQGWSAPHAPRPASEAGPQSAPHPQPAPQGAPHTSPAPPPPGAAFGVRPDPYGAHGAPPLTTAPVAAAPRRRPGWVPMAATATAAALSASLLTAGLTGAFEPEETTAVVPTLGEEAAESSTVPTSSTGTPDWQAVADTVRPSVVAIDVRTSSGGGAGSGVVIDAEGHILTNHHVVSGAVDGGLRVTLADGRVLAATVVGTDATTDLAVIVLTDPPSDLEPATLGDSDDVEVGEPVMAVGNPLGLDSTVTTGIVSALDRPVTTSDGGDLTVVTNAIQIDAAINPGNSGGPLFDASGSVIGINSSIASMPTGAGGSTGSIGLGFAIPSNLADRVGAELIAEGEASHAYLGVGLSDGTAEADGVARRGAVVEQVSDGTPAADAGMRVGDVVVAVDGDAVSGAESLTAFVRERAVGSDVTLTVVRDGTSTEVEVTLAERPETTATPQQQESTPQLPPGVTPEDLEELFGR
ncbi:trypsin-like peptidase domain-containing protein [Actinotalea sp. AC32]|nr:trypsin-like peptidase domain-containing protein [Actinotalea sp. AC32]